nr:reverse transcriptase domain-containing protein [Tanacetum cinerariifolium]
MLTTREDGEVIRGAIMCNNQTRGRMWQRPTLLGLMGKVGMLRKAPFCNKCKFHHTGPCTMKCSRCTRVGHVTRDCKTPVPITTQRLPIANQMPEVTCFGCGAQGHFKSECPKLKNQNRGNQKGNKRKDRKDLNVVIDNANLMSLLLVVRAPYSLWASSDKLAYFEWKNLEQNQCNVECLASEAILKEFPQSADMAQGDPPTSIPTFGPCRTTSSSSYTSSSIFESYLGAGLRFPQPVSPSADSGIHTSCDLNLDTYNNVEFATGAGNGTYKGSAFCDRCFSSNKRVQELELQQEIIEDSPAEETLSNPSVWNNGDDEFNPFGGLHQGQVSKQVSVAEKFTVSVTGSFRRVVRGGQNLISSASLRIYLIRLTYPTWKTDGFFDLNGDGRFCVKDVRCLLNDVFLPKAEVPTRNVAVASLFYPLCDSGMEDAAHLFFRCDMAKDVMFLVSRWWYLEDR